ncbi:MAG: hypothetical protein ACOH1V_14100 [Stenotrophomonas sp.]
MLSIMQVSTAVEAPSRHASNDPFQTADLPGVTAWLAAAVVLSGCPASAEAGGAVAVCWQAASERESSNAPRHIVVFIGADPCIPCMRNYRSAG